MRYLIDTHIFIWAMENKKSLSESIKNEITDPNNTVFISVATVWEIIIKNAKKKLKAPKDIKGDIEASNFQLLPIGIEHVLEVKKLLNIHKDPFDRILIAQTKAEGLTLITSDAKIWKYKIPLVKA